MSTTELPDAAHMDEEAQVLVTRAALAGVRFERVERGWRDVGRNYIRTFMCTLGRAAAHALWDMGEMSRAEFDDYIARTNHQRDQTPVSAND